MKAMIAIVVFSILCGAAEGQGRVESRQSDPLEQSEAAVRSVQGSTDGVAWLRLAILYQDGARYKDAERAFRKAVGLLKAQDRSRYADALDRMGTMYVELGRYAKAEVLERKALVIRQEAQEAAGIGRSDMHLSLVAYGKHDLHGAETDAEMAVSLLFSEGGGEAREEKATPEEQMSALIDLALIYCAEDKCEAAIQKLERAQQLATANYPSGSVPVGLVHFLLGYAHVKNGDAQGGAVLMKTGIEEMKGQMGWGHPTYLAALREYRAVLVKAGRGEDAGEVGESIAKLNGSLGSTKNSTAFLGMSMLP